MNNEVIEIVVSADWNDADYINNDWSTDEKGLAYLKEFLEKYPILKERMGVETLKESGELSDEDTDYLDDILPHAYEGGYIHSIESINVRRIVVHSEEKLI